MSDSNIEAADLKRIVNDNIKQKVKNADLVGKEKGKENADIDTLKSLISFVFILVDEIWEDVGKGFSFVDIVGVVSHEELRSEFPELISSYDEAQKEIGDLSVVETIELFTHLLNEINEVV